MEKLVSSLNTASTENAPNQKAKKLKNVKLTIIAQENMYAKMGFVKSKNVFMIMIVQN